MNYSSLPGNMELLNKCMWDEYRNYFLLLFVLLPILQGPAQMSPLLFWIPYPGRINHTFCVPVALYTHFYYSTYQIASYFIIGLPRATTTPESTIHTKPGNRGGACTCPLGSDLLQSKDPEALQIACILYAHIGLMYLIIEQELIVQWSEL